MWGGGFFIVFVFVFSADYGRLMWRFLLACFFYFFYFDCEFVEIWRFWLIWVELRV